MNTAEIRKMDREHLIYSWKAQANLNPIIMDRAEGVYLWDTDGKRYLDFAAGLLSVNLGHGNEHVLKAIREQSEKLTYVATMYGTEPKARLGQLISEVTPGDLDYVFFTNGGAESIENAIKAARWATGRHKIYSNWRGYHGASSGAITLTGDPRTWPCEPGIPGVVKYFGPYPYNCPFGSTDPDDCGEKTLKVLKTQVMLDNPKSIAAIFVEPIVGTNGIIIPPKNFMKGLRQLCDENGILLVADEVMAGWGRSGKWFGMEHFDVVADIMVTAKGLTSSYVPLGAMIWGKKVWDHFQEKPFASGLTFGGHALACATGVACIEEYRRLNLIEQSRVNGEYLKEKLLGLMDRHPSVGDVRCIGLWACIELTSDRANRAPLAGFNDTVRNVSAGLLKSFVEQGIHLFAKWDYIFMAPPLIVTREQIDEGVAMIDEALKYTDSLL